MGPPREGEEGPELPRPPGEDQVPGFLVETHAAAKRPRPGRSGRAFDPRRLLIGTSGPGERGPSQAAESAGSVLDGEGRRELGMAARAKARLIASRTPSATAVPTKRIVGHSARFRATRSGPSA